MPHKIKGQKARQYRPSSTRRASGLSPINENQTNKLRQSVKRAAQIQRNIREKGFAQRGRFTMRNASLNRNQNTALRALVEKLNSATEKVQKHYETQMTRLHRQAVALNALRDPNYLNATAAARNIHKKALAKLHGMRNKVVNELVRNSTSSQIRRNLYTKGVQRGRHGTSEPNWQNWPSKLWHKTELKKQVNNFFR